MIRLLKETDRHQVLTYLNQEAAYNIFPIGDIEQFGFDQVFQHVYGEFDDNQQLISVFLRYREHAIYYAHKPIFNTEYLHVFDNHRIDYISGKTDVADLFAPYFPNFKRKREFFCQATTLQNPVLVDKTIIHHVKTEADCAKLYDLLVLIDDFGIYKKSKEDFIEGKMHGLQMGETIYIEQDNQFVATVATTAETTKNAMVVAVATHPDYRQKGYASMLMTYMMDYYLHTKQKQLCLFYDNPKAGAIYLRLGFEYMGTWDMFEREI